MYLNKKGRWVKWRHKTEEERKAIVQEFLITDLKLLDFAKSVNMAPKNIYYLLRKYGSQEEIKRHSHPDLDEIIQILKEYFIAEKLEKKQILQKYQISLSSINFWLKNFIIVNKPQGCEVLLVNERWNKIKKYKSKPDKNKTENSKKNAIMTK